MEQLSTDAVSFDLTIDIDDDETQGEVQADCGCTLERTEFSVGFLFCDFHRSAPAMRERLLAEGITIETTP
jgi:hypothetical protein